MKTVTTAYYNEWEPYPAQWLRNLIKAGLIAPGDVDERSIKDVKADDLKRYTQCHFFAGIGGWSYALRLAGWGDDRPVWTGSCPCQPYSIAGKELGQNDERHLWPSYFDLIKECKPSIVFGEQVVGAISHGWLDDVYGDLEREGYATASAILPACCVGAEHERKRLWFVADSEREGRERFEHDYRLSSSAREAYAESGHPFFIARSAVAKDFSHLRQRDGVSVSVERSCIKGYGNAIVPQVAAQFIEAFMEVRP